MSFRARAGAVLAAAFLSGCSPERDAGELFAPEAVGLLVLDCQLLVGKVLPPVYVRETLPPGESYSLSKAAVRGATVTIRRGAVSYVYVEQPDTLATYVPPVGAPAVLPSVEYELLVSAPDGRSARAVTRTPAPFHVEEWAWLSETTLEVVGTLRTFEEGGDSVYQEPENQMTYLEDLLEARFTRDPAVPGYQVGILSLDLGSPLVLQADFLTDEDLADIERAGSSPPFEAADGTIRMPWFAIAYEGRHKVLIFAMDQNWFDYVRSSPEFTGGGSFGGNAGDAFERPIFHVEGGIGLFGSAAVDSLGFIVHPGP